MHDLSCPDSVSGTKLQDTRTPGSTNPSSHLKAPTTTSNVEVYNVTQHSMYNSNTRPKHKAVPNNVYTVAVLELSTHCRVHSSIPICLPKGAGLPCIAAGFVLTAMDAITHIQLV